MVYHPIPRKQTDNAKVHPKLYVSIEGTDDSILGIINTNNLDKDFVGKKLKQSYLHMINEKER